MRRKPLLLLCVCLFLLIGMVPAGLSAQSFADSAFESVWQRTDKPIADGRVARSWMWGPSPFTEAIYEPYAESPGGSRMVQYFDKSRMEINDPNADRSSAWFVTNGLLVREMVDGRVQIGDASFEKRNPAQESVAGDPVANNPKCPTYLSFVAFTFPVDNRTGQKVTATMERLAMGGGVEIVIPGNDDSKAGYSGTEIAYYEEVTGHNVPKALWDFMNQSGLIYASGSYRTGKVVDWLFAMGYPISEPYWARCTVAGEEKDVLVQLFERRVLSYTPSNPAGEFLMGSDPNKDKDARDSEQPQHTLYLPDYYLARTPVANEQYAAFVEATRRDPPKHWKGGRIPKGKENHPVVYVAWRDALAYCRWLAEVAGRPYTLPSEAEWEKGARGTDGREFPWGDQLSPEQANYRDTGIGRTSAVGCFPGGKSPYGLEDLSGNVWEWTRSLWGADWKKSDFGYPYDPSDGRQADGYNCT